MFNLGIHVFSVDLEYGFLMFRNANAGSSYLDFKCFAADLGFWRYGDSSVLLGIKIFGVWRF